jgi:hypothetical protein
MEVKTNSEYLGLSNYKQYEDNPFMSNLIFPIGKKNAVFGKSEDMILNTDTGEVKENALFIGRKIDVDKEQFVKIFHAHLSAIFDLSKCALKIFSYIASVTQYDDQIIFNLKKCSEFTGYKGKESIYKGLAELCNAEIIARTTEHNMYFINPQILYRGDRMVLVTEYRQKKMSKILPDPNQISLFE